jgi:O-antigen/teichoic acid export membrane protein
MSDWGGIEKASKTGRHMIRGAAYISITEAFSMVGRFVTAVFLARFLGPTPFGLFMLTATLVVWLELSVTSLFYGATVKFIGETLDSEWESLASMIVRLHFIAGATVCLLLLLLAEPLAKVLHEEVLAGYLRWYAIEIPMFGLARAQSNIIVGRGFFKKRALIGAVHSLARLTIIMFLVGMGLSVKGAIIGSVTATIIEVAMGRLCVRVPVFGRTPMNTRDFWRFAGPLFMSAMSLRIFRLDLFALKALGATAAQAGFYSAANNLSMPSQIFGMSVSPTTLATMSRLLSQGEEQKAREIGVTVMRSILWLLPFTVMVAGMTSEIVEFVFTLAFLPAAPILSLLIFAALGIVTINILKAILTAFGKPMWNFKITGPMVPFALVGYILLVPRLGTIGAAIVTTSGACLAALVSFIVLFKTCGLGIPARTILHSLLCSILSLVAAIVWPVSGFVVVVKMGIIGSGILAIFLLLREFKTSDLNLVTSLIKSRLGIG